MTSDEAVFELEKALHLRNGLAELAQDAPRPQHGMSIIVHNDPRTIEEAQPGFIFIASEGLSVMHNIILAQAFSSLMSFPAILQSPLKELGTS